MREIRYLDKLIDELARGKASALRTHPWWVEVDKES